MEHRKRPLSASLPPSSSTTSTLPLLSSSITTRNGSNLKQQHYYHFHRSTRKSSSSLSWSTKKSLLLRRIIGGFVLGTSLVLYITATRKVVSQSSSLKTTRFNDPAILDYYSFSSSTTTTDRNLNQRILFQPIVIVEPSPSTENFNNSMKKKSFGGGGGIRHQYSAYIPPKWIPIKPRTMGYYFATTNTSSFVGAERFIFNDGDEGHSSTSSSHQRYQFDLHDHHAPRVHRQKMITATAIRGDNQKRQQVTVEQDTDSKEYSMTAIMKDAFQDTSKDCVAQYEWQLSYYPTCNHLMEIDMMTNLYDYSTITTTRHEVNNNNNNIHFDDKDEQQQREKAQDEGSNDDGERNIHSTKQRRETSMSSLSYISSGFWRDVWKVDHSLPRGLQNNYGATAENHDKDNRYYDIDSYVLKTIRYTHDYVPRNYDRHRRDAVAMERLTSSIFVMDIYASCGNSGLFEFADGGSLDESVWYSSSFNNATATAEGDYNNEEEEEEVKPWTSEERLVVAYQAAAGVAAVHNVAKEGEASIAHTDITTSQFVYVEKVGLYKLNDFNRCRFIGWNNKTNEACMYTVGNNPGSLRSPEEYGYKPQTEKVDVYSLGNVVYSILTNRYPFGKEKPEIVAQKVQNGERPQIQESILKSTDPFDQAMLKAIQMCWIQDPKERATARQVQNFITSELERLGVKEDRRG